MQRDSRASCSPSAAQMGEAFPGSFCTPPTERRCGQESGASVPCLRAERTGVVSLPGTVPCQARIAS